MTIEEADRLAIESGRLLWQYREAHEKAMELARLHYGLEYGVTVLRSEGKVGVFMEVLNYFAGQMPWVRIRAMLPPEIKGQRTHFYRPWEKVEGQEAAKVRDEYNAYTPPRRARLRRSED